MPLASTGTVQVQPKWKDAVEISFDDRVVNAAGGLYDGVLFVSPAGMRWTAPAALAGKKLTAQEQQQVTRLARENCRPVGFKVWFENDAPIDQAQLRAELAARRYIPKSRYCLSGRVRSGRVCLAQNGEDWQVFYADGRKRCGLRRFAAEADACRFLLSVVQSDIALRRYKEADAPLALAFRAKASVDVRYDGRWARFAGSAGLFGWRVRVDTMAWLAGGDDPARQPVPAAADERAAFIARLRAFAAQNRRLPREGEQRVVFVDERNKRLFILRG